MIFIENSDVNKLLQDGIEKLNERDYLTIEQQLRLRNLKRCLEMSKTSEKQTIVIVWCELENSKISNLGKCMFCKFGHMTECHHPYDCNSEYCNHYKGDT